MQQKQAELSTATSRYAEEHRLTQEKDNKLALLRKKFHVSPYVYSASRLLEIKLKSVLVIQLILFNNN